MISSRDIHCADDARRLAKRRLPWMIVDYIDGAAGYETGARRNRTALDAQTLEPRILQDVSSRSLAKPVFGHAAERPFGIAPMGMCNLAGPGADQMLARLAARYKVPLGISTMSTTPMEDLLTQSEG